MATLESRYQLVGSPLKLQAKIWQYFKKYCIHFLIPMVMYSLQIADHRIPYTYVFTTMSVKNGIKFTYIQFNLLQWKVFNTDLYLFQSLQKENCPRQLGKALFICSSTSNCEKEKSSLGSQRHFSRINDSNNFKTGIPVHKKEQHLTYARDQCYKTFLSIIYIISY